MDARKAARDAERADAVHRIRRGIGLTIPVVLAGAMTATGIAGPLAPADAAPRKPAPTPRSALLGASTTATVEPTSPASPATPAATIAPAAVAPSRYVVVRGDTISGIAARFGLRTADVLARNGLGSSSLIFPGQVIALAGAAVTPTAAVSSSSSSGYVVRRGDTVSGIAQRLGLSTQAILDANGLTRTSIIYPGQTLRTSGALAIQTVSSVTPTSSAPTPSDPTTPVVSTPAPVISDTYTVRTGDTVSALAARFGVSAAAILQANGLGATSIIYAGRTLLIPGVTAVQDGSTVTPLTAEMAANARIVIQVGRQLGVPDRGIVIALAAAMQESSLRNLSYGDRDSVGVFQQRPSTGWGSVAQLTGVGYAARLFYGGPSNPNAGRTRGLLDIPGWQSMTLTQAAQAVQRSAYPNAYARWDTSATAWYSQLR